MESELGLAACLALWVPAVIAIAYVQWSAELRVVGLAAMYVLSVALNHLLGAIIYIFPWYSSPFAKSVEAGFRETTYGVLAFVIGSVIIAPLLMKLTGWSRSGRAIRQPDPRLATIYLAIALCSFFVLMPLGGQIPTLTAVLSSGWTLIVVGLCLKAWGAWRAGDRKHFLLWVALTMLLPFTTVVTQGFIGYGTVAMIAALTFIAGFYRPRWQVVLAVLIGVYLGLSTYVTYMRDRGEIRDTVWGGERYSSRLDQIMTTIQNAEAFDIHNEDHLRRIDDRLNQNNLVGAAVNYFEEGHGDFARGETIWDALIALVPRFLWPEKPVVAGSGGLVTRYTGIYFAEGTSVGIGQVMEFYVNFGTRGVLIGFLIIGVIIGVIDRFASARLVEGDWQGFTIWILPGLGFLQVGGSLVEVTSTAGASLMLALFINKVIFSGYGGKLVERKTETSDSELMPAHGCK
jgi:uncharacterized membrane protein (DUF106 family)